MMKQVLLRPVVLAGLALALPACLAGCGAKGQTAAATAPAGTTPPGGSSLPPTARAAMQAQQQRESADRAAHTPRPH